MMKMRRYFVLWVTLILSCKSSPDHSAVEEGLGGKTMSISNTAGWIADERYSVSQPSNIITHNGYSYVFYVKEPVNSSVAGTGYGGTIHYAFSRDQGRTWSDQGLVLNTGLPDQFDGLGVSKPAVIKATDDSFFYLYYVGAGAGFTNSDGSPANRTSIGLAKLIFNDDGGIRIAIKLNSAKPVLEPSDIKSGRFDAFRVDDPNPINLNGQVWLYYTGLDTWGGTTRMGLAISADINQSHIKQNNVRALLDGNPTLVQRNDIGVIAVFGETQIAWYAPDGLKFSKLKQKLPSPIKYARGNSDQAGLTWGLAAPTTPGQAFNRWQLN